MDNAKNYFSWSELTTTDTGLSNNPSTPLHLANLACLWNCLNHLREKLGQPIIVNSAFRSREVNAKLPTASKNSWHLYGRAADIRTLPNFMPKLKSLLQEEQKGKLIVEFIDKKTFFHISI